MAQVQEMWRMGRINGQTPCWQDGFSSWVPLQRLLDLLAPAPQASPPAPAPPAHPATAFPAPAPPAGLPAPPNPTGYPAPPSAPPFARATGSTGYTAPPQQTGYPSGPQATGYTAPPHPTGFPTGPGAPGFPAPPPAVLPAPPQPTGFAQGHTPNHHAAAAPEATGYVLVLLPVASAIITWFWVGSMNLFQNPFSMLMGLTIGTILITAGLMAWEARELGMGAEHAGRHDIGPAIWMICGVLLWPVALPAYLYARRRYGRKNRVAGGIVAAAMLMAVAGVFTWAIEAKKAEVQRELEQMQRKREQEQRLRLP